TAAAVGGAAASVADYDRRIRAPEFVGDGAQEIVDRLRYPTAVRAAFAAQQAGTMWTNTGTDQCNYRAAALACIRQANFKTDKGIRINSMWSKQIKLHHFWFSATESGRSAIRISVQISLMMLN